MNIETHMKEAATNNMMSLEQFYELIIEEGLSKHEWEYYFKNKLKYTTQNINEVYKIIKKIK